MNANELADGINSPHNACCYRDKCRQQQAEIEAMKSQLHTAHNQLFRNQQQGNIKQGYGAEFEEWIRKAQEK